ncbi:hypothetical protein F8388_016117 [Cannabis sativa]|uniref:Xylanase inhibitor C-terminal domain-containing protein n=1 Tax=Cannabis sativa TaxID=3483 RepID=A0A7J6H686_CANSA|nr:hypothetical protein F8388_016117 [Cannabis sativa]KAF4390178.1 hypothetical protein G4B88_005096 [Cannabis sativa]
MEVTFFLMFCLFFNILHFSSPVISRRLQKSYTSFNLIHSHSIHTSLQTQVYAGDRDIITEIFPNDEYLVFINLTIGVPPIPQLVIFDTGSNPNDDPNPCGFVTYYASGLNASGIYGTETFVMPTSDGGVQIIPNKIFGCAHKVYYSGETFGPYIFTNKNGATGLDAIIDTGSSSTTLPENFVTSLQTYVKEMLYELGVKEHEGATGKLLCFRGDLREDLKEFPKVMIRFEGEASMELDRRILFKQHTKRAFCFMIGVTIVDSGKIMVIGAVTQQNYHMAYDLDYKRLYMEKNKIPLTIVPSSRTSSTIRFCLTLAGTRVDPLDKEFVAIGLNRSKISFENCRHEIIASEFSKSFCDLFDLYNCNGRIVFG